MPSDPFDDPSDRLHDVAQLAELGIRTSSLLHELRQPLFAIKATAELAVARGQTSPHAMAAILDQVGYLEALLAHYGRSGRAAEPLLRHDLRSGVHDAIAMVQHRADRAGVALSATPPAEPVWVHGRGAALRQIFLNLLANALDALDGTKEPAIHLSWAVEPHQVTITLSDNGPGIPDGLRTRLGEPFVTTKPLGKGTGLGLYIVEVLTEELGGSICALHPPVGAALALTLPLQSEAG